MADVDTWIVVPCFNEAARLPSEAFIAHLETDPSVAFLFVDDGSTDDTADVLRRLCKVDTARLQMLDLPRNSGKSGAVRQGILAALERGTAYVGFWDADLATPLDEIDRLREALASDARLVGAFGSRVRLLGRTINRRLLRHYIGRVFATLAGLTLAVPVYDTQCGAKLFRASEVTAGLFSEPFLSRWIFDVEIVARLMHAHRSGRVPPIEESLIEVPLMRWTDISGSKLTLRHMCGAQVDLLRIRRHYRH